MSQFISAFVAAFVGFAASIAVLLAAAKALGASPAETVSVIVALAIAKAAASIVLSLRSRQPMICAWSTPGAALIATSTGISLPEAVGAFVVAACLMLLTAFVKPLGRAVAAIPMPIASAMLAGIVFRFVVAAFDAGTVAPLLIFTMFAVFMLVRLARPVLAVVAALAAGLIFVFATGAAHPPADALQWPRLVLITPVFDLPTILGLGVPLYLVTMASQNLPGFAVLRAAGYEPPVNAAIGITALASLLTAPFGAHMSNMAAISAAICTGPETHRDPAKRWIAGLWYGLWWLVIAGLAGSILAVFAGLPSALILGIGGLGLLGSLAGSLSGAMAEERTRFAAVIAFAIAASGLTLFGVGAAFWGLVAGLIVLAGENAMPQSGRKRI